MVRRRIGNNIDIEWSVYRDNTPEDFSGKTIEVYLLEKAGKIQKIADSLISISGNTVRFTWLAGNQYSVGTYSIILKEYINGELCNTVDIADAIDLVPNTALEDGDADYVSDSSVTFRSDFDVIFKSIDKAYEAAKNAEQQALIAQSKEAALISTIASATTAYDNLKELLDNEIVISATLGYTVESFFEEDEKGDLRPKPKADGSARGIYTDSFISSGGLNEETGGSEGGIAEVTIKFDDIEPNPEGYKTDDNGVIILPNYPTVEDIDLSKYLSIEAAQATYLTIEDAANSYASKQDVNEFKALFNSMFVKVDDGNGNVSIKALLGLWSDSFISSGGLNDDITSGSVINSLGDITDVTITNPTNGQGLVYRDGVWVNSNVGGGVSDWSEITNKPTTLAGYGITDALSTSGGTISNSNWGSQLTLNGDGTDAGLKFTNSGNFRGLLYTNNDGRLGWYDMSGADHTLIHSGNYSDYALPKSGGTIESTLFGSLEIKRTAGPYSSAVKFSNNVDGVLGYIGVFGSGNGQGIVPFWNDGTNDYTLIHSGNIGSQSVARANGLAVGDIRDTNPTPNDVGDFGVSAWFSNVWNPTGATWNSGISVKGWADNYAVWQLAASSNYGGNNQELYFRLGEGAAWNAWKRLLFNNDDNARFLNSSIVAGKYNTALTLQTNVASQNKYQCGLAFNCLGAYSSTYENHTHAWIGLGPVVDSAAAEIYPLVFGVNGNTTVGTNPIERMRILPNGYVGIGTTSPLTKLDVDGGGARITSYGTLFRDTDKPNGYNPTYMSEIYQWQDTIYFTRNNPTTGSFLQSVASINLATGSITSSGASFGGNVYLRDTTGSASTSYKLWFVRRTTTDDYWDYGIYAQSTKGLTFCQSNQGVNTDIAWIDGNGNIYATGGITARYASDKRLKEDIQTISTEVALATIMALNPITFKWNSKATELCSWLNGESQGFIAQDYEALIPNSGSEMWGQYRGIDYNRAIPYIVAVEQNHETRIQQIISVEQNHETRIKQLEQELDKLRREYYGNR